MTKILVLGRTGMLGHMVCQVLSESEKIQVHGTTVHDESDGLFFDAEDGTDGLEEMWATYSGFDYVVNCIGVLGSSIGLDNPLSLRRAIRLNTLLPHELAHFAETRGARVIHMSTDGVFLGDAEFYDEDSTHDCEDLYGITKSLGEVYDNEGFLNIRSSIVGPSPYERGGLLEWFLNQQPGSTVSGFTDQIWHGASTYQFAKLCLTIMETNGFDRLRAEASVFHFAPNEPLSKYQLLELFREEFGHTAIVRAAKSQGGGIKRILTTKYRGLRDIYRHGIPAHEMVKELALYMKSRKKENCCG